MIVIDILVIVIIHKFQTTVLYNFKYIINIYIGFIIYIGFMIILEGVLTGLMCKHKHPRASGSGSFPLAVIYTGATKQQSISYLKTQRKP